MNACMNDVKQGSSSPLLHQPQWAQASARPRGSVVVLPPGGNAIQLGRPNLPVIRFIISVLQRVEEEGVQSLLFLVCIALLAQWWWMMMVWWLVACSVIHLVSSLGGGCLLSQGIFSIMCAPHATSSPLRRFICDSRPTTID